MTTELTTAIDILAEMDNPQEAFLSHEAVISALLSDHGMDMSDAHTVLCTANYLYTHGLTAVKA